MNQVFFDMHCHLFNLIDVPLWETFSGAMKMHTLIGLATILKGDKILEGQRYFIRFFERSSETNILWLSGQIRQAIDRKEHEELAKYLGYPSSIVLTPLVMDFDNSIESLPDMTGDENVESQYNRLHRAIVDCKDSLCSGSIPMRVFPFMGFALDKLNGNDPNKFLVRLQEWWRHNGISREERTLTWNSMPQKAIGIKLYPALGFQPYPSAQNRPKYIEFYHWCIENEIPLTVHCQPSAFNPQRPGGNDQNSSPGYWQKVLETEGLQTLRINFAHFGGGEGISRLFDEYGNINTKNETYLITRMLLDYPNTYADLAAIDFSDSGVSNAFANLLTKDLHGDLNSNRSLCEKLIWGTDVPMVLESPQYQKGPNMRGPQMGYVHCLQYFMSSLSKIRSIVAGQPYQYSQTKQMAIMQQVVGSNPELFLHAE